MVVDDLLAVVQCIQLLLVCSVDVLGQKLAAHAVARKRGRVYVQKVDLLKRQALRFRNKEEREDDAAETCRSPNEEHLRLKVCMVRVDKVGSRVTDTEIPEPVRCGGKRHALGADVKREDLASDDPSNRTPSRREESDIDATDHSSLVPQLRETRGIGLTRMRQALSDPLCCCPVR